MPTNSVNYAVKSIWNVTLIMCQVSKIETQ